MLPHPFHAPRLSPAAQWASAIGDGLALLALLCGILLLCIGARS